MQPSETEKEKTLSQNIVEIAREEMGVEIKNTNVERGERSSEFSWDIYDQAKQEKVHFWIRYDNATGDVLERKWTTGEGAEARVIRYDNVKLMNSIDHAIVARVEGVAVRNLREENN